MHRSFVIAALLALATGCAGAQSRPLVVLVHGRGHLGEDTALLRRSWKTDLDTALARAGFPALRDADVRLAWYADVLDPAREAACAPPRPEADSAGMELFARDFLSGLAGAIAADSASRDVRVVLGDLLYVVDPGRRCAARQRVREVLDSAAAHDRPVIVLAYSLGSLVSYGALRSVRDPSPLHARLITLGSPLGNPELRSLLGAGDPLAIPRPVLSWENVYDPNDAFAAPLEGVVTGVRDLPLAASTRGDPHYVARYLRDPAVGAALGRALCGFRGGARDACSAARDVARSPAPR